MSKINLVSDHHKIIISYINKSACSFIAEWYVRDVLLNRDPKIKAINYLTENKIYSIGTDFKRYQSYRYYLVIRCPIERCISCFINKFVLFGENLKLTYETVEPFIGDLLKRYSLKSISFNVFLDIIESELKNSFTDGHINHQIDHRILENIKSAGLSLTVIKVDDLSLKLTDISKRLGIIPSFDYFKKINNSKYTLGEYTDITDVNCFDINPVHLDKMNFKSAFPRILEIYKLDNQVFNGNLY
jgi:hypothetical protein